MNPRQVWMALPRRTRLEAVRRAKQGRAHPSRGVRVAAMAWGPYAPRLIAVRVSIGLVVTSAMFLVPLANDWPFPIPILGLLPMAAFMAGEGYAQRRWEGWHRMLGPVNGRQVLLDQAGTAQPLEVRRSFVARYAVHGYLLLAVTGPTVIELTGAHSGNAVLLAAVAIGLAWRAYWRSRHLPQPPLRIDGSGVTFHHLGWMIPWSAIAYCNLSDQGDQTESHEYDTATGVVWKLRRKELGATLATIPEPVRKTVTAWLEDNDYAVVLNTGQLTEPPERVAAASRRYLERSGGGAERISRSRRSR